MGGIIGEISGKFKNHLVVKDAIYCRNLIKSVENSLDAFDSVYKVCILSIEALKSGSQDAFRSLVEHYSSKIVSTCYRFVKNAADAEDVAQEVFLEVYQSVRSFRSEADLNTWIYRIAVNKSLDFVRKQKRKKRLADLRGLFFFQKGQNAPPTSPLGKLERAERQEILAQQIERLCDNQKIALVLSQYEQLPNKEIAAIMQTSESAVESLLHRARANLRKHLEEYFEKNLDDPQGRCGDDVQTSRKG